MISYAKSLPSWNDARPIANYLNWQFRNSGTPEVFARIDSIARYFKDHCEQAIAERVKRQIESHFHKQLRLPQIRISDHQVMMAVIEVMPQMFFDNQWVAIYRILVDFCCFPSEIQAFCDRMDSCLGSKKLLHPCKYQNIQKNLSGIMAKPYQQWNSYDGRKETGFLRQKRVADLFLTIVKRMANDTKNIQSTYSF